MPSQLAKVARGFLSLLDLQAQGRNPNLLGDGVQPVVEMLEFYEGTLLTQVSSFGLGTSVIANAITIQVPAGELYIPKLFAAQSINGAANQVTSLALRADGINLETGSFAFPVFLASMLPANQLPQANGAGSGVSFVFPKGMQFGPKSNFFVDVIETTVTTNSTNIRGYLWFTKLKV